MMKLIGSPTSPYVRKVRVVMAEKKIDYQFVIENIWAPDTTIEEFNPLGKVPCLLMDDGEAVFDSRVICEYVDTLTPVGKLIPPAGRERVAVRCWEALGDGVCDAGALIRQEILLREPAQRSESWVARQTRKVEHGIAAMSKGLGNQAWCASNHLTLADISIGCALDYVSFRMPEINWRETYPNLSRHLDKLSQRASFADTIPKA
jgi:glutathione S-transferase